MANKDRPLFKSIDMTQAMIEADKGKYTYYSTYRFNGGNKETYKDKINGTPRFVGRI